MGKKSFLLGCLILCIGFLGGQYYEFTLMNRNLQVERLKAAIQHCQDWQRFANHIREDYKKFGRLSLLFPSDQDLKTLKEVSKSTDFPLKVYQSPIDFLENDADKAFMERIPILGNGISLLEEASPDKSDGKSLFFLKMTVGNSGEKPVSIEKIWIEDSKEKKIFPSLLRSSLASNTIPPFGIDSLECEFQIPKEIRPMFLIVSNHVQTLRLPIIIVKYKKSI
jgi:hypothetical protein